MDVKELSGEGNGDELSVWKDVYASKLPQELESVKPVFIHDLKT